MGNTRFIIGKSLYKKGVQIYNWDDGLLLTCFGNRKKFNKGLNFLSQFMFLHLENYEYKYEVKEKNGEIVEMDFGYAYFIIKKEYRESFKQIMEVK